MTHDFWLTIRPQLEEIISSHLSEANPADSMIDTLKDMQWWTKWPYSDMYLHHEHNDMRIKNWISAMESLMGEECRNLLIELLRNNIHSTIEYCWAIRMKELQEELEHEGREAA